MHLSPKLAGSLALAAALPRSALAQLTAATTGGAASVLTGAPRNRPTQAWTQWQPKPSYALSALPDQYMGKDRLGNGPNIDDDQTGFNTCASSASGGAWNQQSQCQTAWLNGVDDFCLWGPPTPDTIGASERRAVAYCTRDTHGTRLIPDGTLQSVHFVRTSEYAQVTGLGDFTAIGLPLGDDGGEMDSAGMDDLSNPIGGVVYTTAKPGSEGTPVFAKEWTNFMSWNRFCFRVCWGDNAERHCEHRYDVLGCAWNIPANYEPNVFESCEGANAPFQGVYTVNGQASTFAQGDAVTPDPHPAPASSNCRAASSVGNGGLLVATPLAALQSSTGVSTAPTPTAAAGGMQTSRSAANNNAQQTGANAGAASNGARLGAGAGTLVASAVALAAGLGALLV